MRYFGQGNRSLLLDTSLVTDVFHAVVCLAGPRYLSGSAVTQDSC